MVKTPQFAVFLLLGCNWLAPVAQAAVDPSLSDLMRAASACTDDRLKADAARSCDAPTLLATRAIRECQDKWHALALVAVRPPPGDAGKEVKSYRRALETYEDGMAYEYSKIAELKAIDIRASAVDPETCSAE